MLLNFLGRGSAFNVNEGNNSAYLKLSVRHNNDTLFLIDCGESIFQRIINKKILDDKTSVNILITHLDSDHVGSLSSLVYYCYYIKHVIPNIYFPKYDLYDLLKNQGHSEGVDYKFHLLNAENDNFIETGNIKKIKPIKVEHVKTLNCFGYLIYLDSKLIWYSGDCSGVSNVINEYHIDEFYQDTCLADYDGNVHTSLRTLCENIPREKRNVVYCMHIDCDELIEKAEKEYFNVVK